MAKKKISNKAIKPLFTDSNWTFPLLKAVTEECEIIATEELKLNCYENQIEIISSDQMLDAYASVGMPVMYQHWSWGKSFVREQHNYQKGYSGLAYEIVINSSPTISYLMEENTATMQALVIAHAAFGHNSFFKSNEFVRQWTDAEGIMDYLVFAKDYISDCEKRYGYEEVEKILDSAHALMHHGVDRYTRPNKLSAQEEKANQIAIDNHNQRDINELWNTLPRAEESETRTEAQKAIEFRQKLLKLPEENLLYFIEKKSPTLKTWQRECIRIVRKVSQYFYPQGQTKVMNEGWASYSHYYIMNRLHEKGLLTDGSMLEFLHSHSSVLYQVPFDHPGYNGFNPYALGFAIYDDIKRICEEPTKEDEEWFPDLVGKPPLPELHFAMENFRDESFIRQYLSPTLIRKFRLFQIHDDSEKGFFSVDNIHNSKGYKNIRSALADQYSLGNIDPDLQIVDVNLNGNRCLELVHHMRNSIPLNKNTDIVLKHVSRLWGYGVKLESVDSNSGVTTTYQINN